MNHIHFTLFNLIVGPPPLQSPLVLDLRHGRSPSKPQQLSLLLNYKQHS
jgi:hypothetical protein